MSRRSHYRRARDPVRTQICQPSRCRRHQSFGMLFPAIWSGCSPCQRCPFICIETVFKSLTCEGRGPESGAAVRFGFTAGCHRSCPVSGSRISAGRTVLTSPASFIFLRFSSSFFFFFKSFKGLIAETLLSGPCSVAPCFSRFRGLFPPPPGLCAPWSCGNSLSAQFHEKTSAGKKACQRQALTPPITQAGAHYYLQHRPWLPSQPGFRGPF